MKRSTIYLTFLIIILLTIFICTAVSAEGGKGGAGLGDGNSDASNTNNSSIWAGLLSIKYILGGFVALSGLILLKTVKINQNRRTLLMCFVFVLFGVLVIMHQPSPLRSLVDAISSLQL